MTTPNAPPKQQVADKVRAILPTFIYLDSIEIETIPSGTESATVNFKATITPREDLYVVDRVVEGTPKVTLLKVVQAEGTKASLYGSVGASRIMDKWTVESPQIQVGLRQFGAPRGAFDAQSYVTGSKEAGDALMQQKANAELQERSGQAAIEQRERERKAREEQQARDDQARREREEQNRIALDKQKAIQAEQLKKEEEQRKKAEEAARQKLILATVTGTRYIGTITCGDEHQRIRLVFTEQKNFLIRAEASNPDRPDQKQTFTGELVFNPKPKEDNGEAYTIVMSPISGIDFPYPGGFPWFYKHNKGSLELMLTEAGVEGKAQMSFNRFIIRLQRER